MLVEIIIGLSVLVFFMLIGVGWFWGGYNTFVIEIQNIKTMWSNIKTEYQRRADLFYNLVESTKSYAKFEKDTLTQVIAMRNGKFGNNVKEDMKKMKQLDGMFRGLNVVFERYPKLRAVENYQSLMKEVRITEDRINIARTEYNDTVRDYNVTVKSFPSNVLAGMFHFGEQEYFENEEGTEKAPKMDLSIK